MDTGKGTLDQFLRRAVLLGGVYVVISTVYDLAYFGRLNLPVDLEGGILWLVPRRLDPYIAIYSSLLWGFIINLPPRYWDYVAQLVSLETWLSAPGVAVQRLWALGVLIAGFAALKPLVAQHPPPDLDMSRPLNWVLTLVVPPVGLFESSWTLCGLVVLSGVGCAVYVRFRVYNRLAVHLRAEPWPHWFMLRSLHLFLPFFLAVLFALFALASPRGSADSACDCRIRPGPFVVI